MGSLGSPPAPSEFSSCTNPRSSLAQWRLVSAADRNPGTLTHDAKLPAPTCRRLVVEASAQSAKASPPNNRLCRSLTCVGLPQSVGGAGGPEEGGHVNVFVCHKLYPGISARE